MYKAYVDNDIFFASDADQDSLRLTTANLTLQAGSSGEFVFTIPPCNRFYGQFEKIKSYVDVYRDDELVFSGRVYSIAETFDTQFRITCEGLLTFLNDSVFRPVTFDGQLHTLVRNILASHNQQVEADKQIAEGRLLISNYECYRAYETYETSISRLQDLVEAFGGWIRIRKENGVLYFDWYDAFIDGTTQKIDFGENLLDITQTEDASSIVTVLIPLGAANDDNVRLTIEEVNSGLDYIEASQTYIDKYGYIVGSNIWDDVTVPSILKAKGQQWLNACLTPKLMINVAAVDLADAGYSVDAFTVGQKIKVTSRPHGLEGEWFDCQEQSLDLLNPANNRLSLGTEQVGYIKASRSITTEIRSSIERIAATYTTKNALQTAIETATSLITGNSGGYVVMHDSDDDGYPDEILIMDTPNIDTAVKVWRFNNSGLGYSSTGYSGTYGLALTMDGAIVADRVTAGTLNADILRTGVIRGQTGNTWWNLVTGEFHMEGGADVDKSKVFVREPTTPYYVGDLWVTGYSKNSGVAGYAIAGDGIVGNEDTSSGAGTIMMCIYTRLTGSFVQADWALVTDYIDASALTQLQERVSTVEINMSSLNAEMELKANTSTVTDLASRVSAAEFDISGQDARIDLIASSMEDVSEEVTNASFTFYQEPIPPYKVGDLWVTGVHEPYNAIAGDAVAGNAVADWGKELYVCDFPKDEDEEFERSDWILATKYIGEEQLLSVKNEIRNAQISIDAANARIDLKADSTTVTDLTTRVRQAEIDIDGAEAQIALKANSSTVTELTSVVNNIELTLDAHEGQIQSKVSATDYNGNTIASLINQSASTVKINADHLEFAGKTVNMTAGALTTTTGGQNSSAIILKYGNFTSNYEADGLDVINSSSNRRSKYASNGVYIYYNNNERGYLAVSDSGVSALTLRDTNNNITLQLNGSTGAIYFRNPLFKIVTKDFWARLSGSASQVYWEEGNIEVTPDSGYEIVGLGGFYAAAYVADGRHSTAGNSSMINVYRAAVAKSSNKFYLYYGFSNMGATTWDVHFSYYLLEAYTKGAVV